jgi:hypothetical protein
MEEIMLREVDIAGTKDESGAADGHALGKGLHCCTALATNFRVDAGAA